MFPWLKPALEIGKLVLERVWLTPKEKAKRAWDKAYKQTKEYIKKKRDDKKS